MKVIVKEVGKPAAVVDVDFKWRNECGNLIEERITNEYVTIKEKEFFMVVDEDGLMKQLPLNFFLAANSVFYPIQAIVGTVVFCRIKWENPFINDLYDFELVDITDEDLEKIHTMLDRQYQLELGRKYFGK